MRILVSAKVLDRNVGGNTRYARNLYAEPALADHEVVRFAHPDRTDFRLREAFPRGPQFRTADLVHYPADTGPLISARCPIIGTIHGVALLHEKDVRNERARQLWMMRTGRLARLSSRIVTVSHSSKSDIVEAFGVPADDIDVIPHGIDHTAFSTQAHDGEAQRISERYGVDGPFVLYLGNIEPRKNLVALAEAADTVQRATGIPLVVAGAAAWDADDSLAAFTRSPATRYVGRVPEEDVAALMRQAAVFAFPSRYEGFGFPVIEAMACGTAVVCSDRGSLPEVAQDNAVLLEDIGAPAISDALISLLRDDDERERRAAAGIAVAAGYTWAASAGHHLRLFCEVAGHG